MYNYVYNAHLQLQRRVYGSRRRCLPIVISRPRATEYLFMNRLITLETRARVVIYSRKPSEWVHGLPADVSLCRQPALVR